MFLFVNNCFVPFADVVFISSNTDALLTHEACVTISSVVTWLEEGQRLGVEAEQALILPGLTFCITKTLIFLTCVLTIILQELQLLICTHLNIGILLPCLKYLNTDYNGDGRKLKFVTIILHQTPHCSKPWIAIVVIWRKLYFYIVAGYEWSRERGCEVATISHVWSSV